MSVCFCPACGLRSVEFDLRCNYIQCRGRNCRYHFRPSAGDIEAFRSHRLQLTDEWLSENGPEYEGPTQDLVGCFDRLAALSGNRWDNINPDEFVRELRAD